MAASLFSGLGGPPACRAAAGPAGVSGAPSAPTAAAHLAGHARARRRLVSTPSYKANRGTVDPMAEIVADAGLLAATLDGPLVAPATIPTTVARPGQPPWPRALRASLTALPTVAFDRAPPPVVAARPSRFPFAGTFTLRPPPPQKGAPPPPPRTLSPADVLALLGGGGLVDASRLDRMRAVAAARTWAVLPVVESNHDRGNLGAVARTADALGFGGLWVASPSTQRYRPTRGRCAAGAEKWLDARVFASKAECVAALKAHGYAVAVAVGPGPGVRPVEDWDWAGTPTAVVLGNEGGGVSAGTLAAADVRLTIPMRGFVESFNVSVAAALILQTARRALDSRAAARGSAGHALSEGEVDALTAAMLLRHKGSAWSAGVLDAMAARAGAAAGAGVVV